MARGKRAVDGAAEPVNGPRELPEGWRWQLLGDAIPLAYGKALAGRDRDGAGSVPVYGSSGLVGRHCAALTQAPAIVVGRKGSAGAVHWSNIPCWPIDTAYFAELRADINPRYAYHLLIHLKLGSLDQSTAIPSLGRDTYSRLVAPFPSLASQMSVATRIDELFAEIDEGEAALADARTGVETYRKALLKAAVTGELTADWRRDNPPKETGHDLLHRILADRRARWEADPKNRKKKYVPPRGPVINVCRELPDGWAWATMEQVSTYITSGSRGWADYYTDQGSVFIRAADLNRDKLDLSDVAHVTIPIGAEGARTLVHRGDILITITGANVTKAGVVTRDIGEAYVSQHVALVRPVLTSLSAFLFHWSITQSGGRGHLARAAYGAGKPGLNLANILDMPVALPSLDEQGEIARVVEAATHKAETMELDFDTESLRQSILSAAFRGELA